MATHPDTAAYILSKLGDARTFSVRPMFGEYALYADGKTVALICDNVLYVKILPASEELKDLCETGLPYPGAKPYYAVTEDLLVTMRNLPQILRAVARSLPVLKKRKR